MRKLSVRMGAATATGVCMILLILALHTSDVTACACADGYVEVDGKCDQCNPPEACVACACTSGYEGTRCGSCVTTETWRWRGECRECHSAIIGFAMVSVLCWTGLGFVTFLFSIHFKIMERYSVLLYCTIKSIQLAAFVADANIDWPFNLSWVLRSTLVSMFVFDPEALPLECNIQVDVIWRWLIMMVSPFVVGIVYILIFAISVPFLKHRVKQLGFLTVRAFLYLILILWGGMVSASAMPFDCTLLDGSGSFALDVDFSVTCWEDPLWWGMSVPGFIFFLMWTIGVPAMITVVGFVGCFRYDYRDLDVPGSFDEYWGLTMGFLYRDFGKYGTIWEAFDMFCRAHIILAERFSDNWPFIHLSVTVIFLVLLISVKMIVRPYKKVWLECVTTAMYCLNLMFALCALVAHTANYFDVTSFSDIFLLTMTIVTCCGGCCVIKVCIVLGPALELGSDKMKATYKSARKEYNDIKVQKEYNDRSESFLQVLIRKYTGKKVEIKLDNDDEAITEERAIRLARVARNVYDDEEELKVLTKKYGGWMLKLLNQQYTPFLNDYHDHNDEMDGEIPFRAVYELEKNVFKYFDKEIRPAWRMALAHTMTLSACDTLEAAVKVCDRAAMVYNMWRIDAKPPEWAAIIQMDLSAEVGGASKDDKMKLVTTDKVGGLHGADIATQKLQKLKKLEEKKKAKLVEFFKDADERETAFDPWIYYFLRERYPQMPHTGLWLINIWEGTIVDSIESGLYKNRWRLLLREFLPEVRHLMRTSTETELEAGDREMFTILIRHLAPVIEADPADIPAARDAQQAAIKEFQEKRKTATASQLGLSDDARNVFLEEGRHWPEGTLEAMFNEWGFLVTEFHNKPVRAFKVLDQWRTMFFAHLRKADIDDWKKKVQRAMLMTPPGSATVPVIEQYLQAYRGSTDLTDEEVATWLRDQTQSWSVDLLTSLERDYPFLIHEFAGQPRLALSIMIFWEENLFSIMEPDHKTQWREAVKQQIMDLPLGPRVQDFITAQRQRYIAKYGTLEQRNAAKRMGQYSATDLVKPVGTMASGKEIVPSTGAKAKNKSRRRSSIFGGRRASVESVPKKENEPAQFLESHDGDIEEGKVVEKSTADKIKEAKDGMDDVDDHTVNEDLEHAIKNKKPDPRVDKAELERSQGLYSEESTNWDSSTVRMLMEKYKILVRMNPSDPKHAFASVELWEKGLFKAVSPLDQEALRKTLEPLIRQNLDPETELPKVVLRQLQIYQKQRHEKRMTTSTQLRAAY